ncbi:hypothetical protein [Paenibacillus sp. sgz500958]|uniref:hypothetical protein n=1 Tax=Paenibacillus sp. sgz500958 TaxID=3242475 RepID=UPI0036D3F211
MKTIKYLLIGISLASLTLMFLYYYDHKKEIIDQDYTEIIVTRDYGKEIVRTITDKNQIKAIIKTINTSKRQDSSKLVFEKGPDGTLIFQNSNSSKEVKFFTETGDIITDKYLIQVKLNLK